MSEAIRLGEILSLVLRGIKQRMLLDGLCANCNFQHGEESRLCGDAITAVPHGDSGPHRDWIFLNADTWHGQWERR